MKKQCRGSWGYNSKARIVIRRTYPTLDSRELMIEPVERFPLRSPTRYSVHCMYRELRIVDTGTGERGDTGASRVSYAFHANEGLRS